MTVHFVYNKGMQLKTPERILHELSQRLARRYHLKTYAIAERETIVPQPGDVLIGHPSRYSGDSVFNRAFRQPGWAKRIVFCPFSHGMPRDAAAIDPLVEKADLYLALCGPYWFETMGESLLSHWQYKTMRCDLGVNRADYPLVKADFNPPGRRRFLYVGNAGPMKGGDIFCALAEANPDLHFGWINWQGPEHRPAGTLRSEYLPILERLQAGRIAMHGGADWRDRGSIGTAAQYDFLLTCGRSDSNPTTILEASAWGLIPIAPLQCGYYGDDWLINIPLDDIAGASAILRALNDAPEAELLARQATGLARIDSDYSWDHAAQQVIACIEAPIPRPPGDAVWRACKAANQKRLAGMVKDYHRRQRREDAIESVARWPRAAARKTSAALGLR